MCQSPIATGCVTRWRGHWPPHGDHLYQAEYLIGGQAAGDDAGLETGPETGPEMRAKAGAKAGAVRWVAAQGRAHFDGDQPVRLVGTVQEITALKRVEAALQECVERFRALAEQTVAGVCLFDRAKCFVFANATFAAMMGCRLNEVPGQPLKRFGAVADWPDASDMFDRDLQAGEAFVVENCCLRPDG